MARYEARTLVQTEDDMAWSRMKAGEIEERDGTVQKDKSH